MLDFFRYFFGKGETVEFVNFTLAHFLPILVAIGLIVLIYFSRDKLRNQKREIWWRYAMAFIMIVSEMSYYWRLIALPELHPNPVDHLPITICGWMTVFASYMVIGKSQTLFDLSYFWCFSSTIFALITPTVITYTGPTRFRYYQFWVEHLAGYVALFYMIFVHKMRPTVKSAIKAYIGLAILGVIAFFTNDLLSEQTNHLGEKANYLFMAAPESTPSLLDILPPNHALRIFIMALAVTVLFFLSYLPWLIMDLRKKKAAASV